MQDFAQLELLPLTSVNGVMREGEGEEEGEGEGEKEGEYSEGEGSNDKTFLLTTEVRSRFGKVGACNGWSYLIYVQ